MKALNKIGVLTAIVTSIAIPALVHAQSSITLTFNAPVGGTIQDGAGAGSGLTSRLPGTGGSLAANDPNLALNTAGGVLSISSTRSDLNGQQNMGTGEYLGINLADLGFTGSQDFSVSATFLNVAYSTDFDQFGLYVGANSSDVFRAGGLYASGQGGYTLTSANNSSGVDTLQTFNTSLAPLPGDNIVLDLSRANGIYSFSIDDLTTPSRSGTLTINQPSYLNSASDLYVGIFAANAGNDISKTATIDTFSASVVPEPSTFALAGLGGLSLFLYRRRK